MASGELADATVVFDLDGTLADTAPDLVRALNLVLAEEGLPPVSLTAVRRMVGQGARVLIERGAAAAGARYSPERLDRLTASFIDYYRCDIARETRPFANATQALDALAQLGAKLAVCTNKPTDLARQLLDALDLSARFSAIVGPEAAPARKPHPDHFRAAVTQAGGVARRAVMVGDSAADVATARGAGAPVVLVRFGYCDEDVERLGADILIGDFAELAPACRRLLAARP